MRDWRSSLKQYSEALNSSCLRVAALPEAVQSMAADALALDQQLHRDKLQQLVDVSAQVQNLLNENSDEETALHDSAASSDSKVHKVQAMLSNALSETNSALHSSLHLINRQISAARRNLVKQKDETNGLVAFGIFAKASSSETTNIADAALLLLPTAKVMLGESRAEHSISTQWKFAHVMKSLSKSTAWQQNLQTLKHATDWSERQAAAETAYTLFAGLHHNM
jgi:hypothetical protein